MKKNEMIEAIASGSQKQINQVLSTRSKNIYVINDYYDLIRMRRTKGTSHITVVKGNSHFCNKVLPELLKQRHERKQPTSN